MRKLFAIAAIVAVAATACNKMDQRAPKMPAVKGEATNVSFNVKGGFAPTRATEAGITAENTVNTVDIFVFFNDGGTYDGQIDAYGHFTATTGTVKATTGARLVYAVVNSEYDQATLSAITDLATFNAKVVNLGTQKKGAAAPYTLDNFTMIGSKSASLVAGDNAVTINVDRVAARVRVKKITRNMDSPARQAQAFVVTDMYISNAVIKDEYDLGYSPVAADFVNQQGVLSSPEDHALWLHRTGFGGGSGQAIVDEHVTASSSWDCSAEANYMYTLPNSVDTDNDGTDAVFAPSTTKLIIKATLNGDVMYFAIPLGEIRANYSYDIEELVITRPGSDDPDKQTLVANVNYTISVNPWTLAPIETENGGEPGDSGSKYVI